VKDAVEVWAIKVNLLMSRISTRVSDSVQRPCMEEWILPVCPQQLCSYRQLCY